MHISKDEQLARFESRRMTPQKSWKLTEEDWRNRKKWAESARTSTEVAPWTVVPGNDKRNARITVLKTVVEGLAEALDFDPSPENLAKLPPVAAPTPIPDWAQKTAKRYGISV